MHLPQTIIFLAINSPSNGEKKQIIKCLFDPHSLQAEPWGALPYSSISFPIIISSRFSITFLYQSVLILSSING